MRLRGAAANLLTLLLGSSAGLGLLELAVRWTAPQATAYAGRGLYLPDDELGHRLRPDFESGDIRTNSWGFRDREYPAARTEGVLRIVVIGDSFTFGSARPEENYPKALERLLAGRAEVINTGVPAYSTVQEVAHLKRFGLPFHPDVVLLGLFLTGDVIENHSDEHLQVVDGELTSRPVSRLERLLLRSHLYRFVRSRLVVHADSPPVGPGTDRFLTTEHGRLQTCRRKPPGHVRGGYAATERLLRALDADLRGRRVGLVVLLIPDEVQVSPELFATVLKSRGEDAALYDLDLPNATVGRMLAGAGIPAVDVLAECRARQREAPVYLPQDTHWNARGHAIAARALKAKLEELYPALRGRG
jgi:hypothetical protein